MDPAQLIRVNRAPVLTLWATVVAERLGYPPETALTLGRFVEGSSECAKDRPRACLLRKHRVLRGSHRNHRKADLRRGSWRDSRCEERDEPAGQRATQLRDNMTEKRGSP
jgi:hypothetical protein